MIKDLEHDDACAIRVIEISQVRAKKLILTKTKVELALVLAGTITDDFHDKSKIYAKEPRIAVSLNMLADKVKG